jgi:penicillin-binding protein 1A
MMKRQLLEYKASLQLHSRLSSEQLLTTYLNRADFGDGAIGIHDASQHYFQKAPRELSIGHAAMLVGLIKSPSRFSPSKHPERAKQRRDEVIQSMVEMQFIDAEAGRMAANSDLQLVQQ